MAVSRERRMSGYLVKPESATPRWNSAKTANASASGSDSIGCRSWTRSTSDIRVRAQWMAPPPSARNAKPRHRPRARLFMFTVPRPVKVCTRVFGTKV